MSEQEMFEVVYNCYYEQYLKKNKERINCFYDDMIRNGQLLKIKEDKEESRWTGLMVGVSV